MKNEKLTVFQEDGPYLVTKKIGKNNPKAEEKERLAEKKVEIEKHSPKSKRKDRLRLFVTE